MDKTQLGRARTTDRSPSTGSPPSGVEATVAAGSSPPSGVEATLAVGSSSSASSPSGLEATLGPDAVVTIRAGARADYRDLVTIERQHYVVGDEIARGGMGRILVARDRRLGREVAIKELLIDSVDLRARFEREARITAKLQHPSIVNILEAGTWPTGEAFYVMKLVTGDSFDKVIAARTTLDKRLALLPNVIAAVDALAYAHDHRVIHRDLKPANVLVGSYGETVVIDWGLAKDLADASDLGDVEAGPYRTADAAPGATVAGSIMGTPAYMPAEQALGETVDERADVYSLGAMLYHVLAGAPPFTGKNADAILAKVVSDVPAPLDAHTPPDLVTIVSKAMAKNASDRYPTAKELAEDLKRFQTGQLVAAHRYSRRDLFMRWIRRHRAVVGVSTAALVILGVLAVIGISRIREERSVAEANGALAVSNRNDVEEVLAFLLTDLRDKLQRTGQVKVLADVAQRVNKYYDARTVNLDDVEDATKRGQALMNLAKANVDFGDVKGARALWTRAGDLAGAGLERHPNDPTFLDIRYRSQIQDAALLEASDPKSARGILDGVLAAPIPAHVSTGDYLLALGHQARGRAAMHLGDNTASLADFTAARDAVVRYLAKRPTDPERARDAAEAEMFLAEQHMKLSKLDDALADLKRALAICDVALVHNLDHFSLVEERSRVIGSIGDVHKAASRLPEALQAYTDSAAAREKLYARDPSAPVSLRMLGKAYEDLAVIEVLSSKLPDALVHMARVQSIREQLHARDPNDPTWSRDLMVAYQRLAYFHQLKGDLPKATDYATRAVDIIKGLVASDPKNVVWRRDLGTATFAVAETQIAQTKLDDALVSLRGTADSFVELAKLEPAVATHKRDLAVIRDRIGVTLATKNDWVAATAEMKIAIAELEPTVVANPDVDEFAMPLSTLYRLHATFASRTKDAVLADVMASAERAVAVLRPAYTRHPTAGNFDLELALALSTAADLMYGNVPARRAEAFAMDQEAETIMVAAVKRDPANAGVKLRLDAVRSTAVAKARPRR